MHPHHQRRIEIAAWMSGTVIGAIAVAFASGLPWPVALTPLWCVLLAALVLGVWSWVENGRR